MKTFKSFIQLDEVEKLKLRGADKLAPDNNVAEVKPLPADLAKLGSVDKTKEGQGKRKADNLGNKQPFGESKMSDLDVQYQDWTKLSDRKFFQLYHITKDAWKLKYKSLFKALQTEAESHQSKTTMKHIDKPNAAEKKAAKDIKPGIPGIRDRFAMLDAAKKRGALKKEDVEQMDEISLQTMKSAKDKLSRKAYDAHMDDNKNDARNLATRSLKIGDKIKDKVARTITHGGKTYTLPKNSPLIRDEEVELLFNLYDQLDENNQEIFLSQLENDIEVLLSFAKTITEE
jgi:hypothetical protein